MALNKTTYCALCAALQMARSPHGRVTAGEVARLYGWPEAAVAKVFQQLVRARLANGARGVGGGHSLARPASRITVLDVIAALEPGRAARTGIASPGPSRGAPDRPLRRLLGEVDELVRCTFESVTLETLVGRRQWDAAVAGSVVRPQREV